MNKLPRINILGVPVNPLTMDEALNYLTSCIEAKKTTNVVTANAEIIMLDIMTQLMPKSYNRLPACSRMEPGPYGVAAS